MCLCRKAANWVSFLLTAAAAAGTATAAVRDCGATADISAVADATLSAAAAVCVDATGGVAVPPGPAGVALVGGLHDPFIRGRKTKLLEGAVIKQALHTWRWMEVCTRLGSNK